MESNPFFMDTKLALIRDFLPQIRFLHVDSLIRTLQNLVERAQSIDGLLVCNINPFMVAEQILEICRILKRDFPLARLPIMRVEDDLI